MAAVDIVLVIILVCLSGLFSGLTLGLLSLDKVGLEIVIDSGTADERKYAQAIYPVRAKGNLLLCTLLLGNTAVNAMLAINLANLTSGTVGSALATGIIVILGEIMPQSICSRHGLAIGYYTLPIVKFFIITLFIVAWPISYCLDHLLGEELGTIYNRQGLKKLISVHSEKEKGTLKEDETSILRGALDYGGKDVSSAMTPLAAVFAMDVESKLTFDTLATIFKTGHSRIPVYEKSVNNIVGLLFAKDLILVNPEDEIPIRMLLSFYNHPLTKVFPDTHLDELLKEFKSGRTHLAVVHDVNNDGPGDPFYETHGIITLEDIIEEIIQAEIVDETDVYEDVVQKKRNKNQMTYEALSLFDRNRAREQLSPQEMTAVFSFLSRNVDLFMADKLQERSLRQLLREATTSQVKLGDTLFRKGEADSECVLVLQGKVTVKAGREDFATELGPWSIMGRDALIDDEYASDFSATVASSTARVLRIARSVYVRARQDTRFTTETISSSARVFDEHRPGEDAQDDSPSGTLSELQKPLSPIHTDHTNEFELARVDSSGQITLTSPEPPSDSQ